jgi:hypothetical protein
VGVGVPQVADRRAQRLIRPAARQSMRRGAGRMRQVFHRRAAGHLPAPGVVLVMPSNAPVKQGSRTGDCHPRGAMASNSWRSE